MAPPRVEDPMAQLMAKIDEGNKETCRHMEAIQASMEKMEATIQALLSDLSEFQRWWPDIEKKVVEMAESLKKIQIQMGKTVSKSA